MNNEQRYFDALATIAKRYSTTAQLRKYYGDEYPEYLEMAYENIQDDAKAAIRGKRRPKPRKPTDVAVRSYDASSIPKS